MAVNIPMYRAAEELLWDSVGIRPTEHFVVLPGGTRVRVLEHGTGPDVLFLHGVSVAGPSWADLAAALPDFRCLLLDRPGCGLSDPLPAPPQTLVEIQRYADALVPEVLDALGLTRANVAATSYGGFFALRGAAAHPDRIARVVEYSWPVGAPIERVAPLMRLSALPGAAAMSSRMPVSRRLVKTMLSQIGLSRALRTGTFDDAHVDWVTALFRHTNTQRNDMRASPEIITPLRGLNVAALHSDALLESITTPCLFLWGDEDPNGGEAVARTFVERMPTGVLEVIRDAGHAPWIDQLELCSTRTREFLAA